MVKIKYVGISNSITSGKVQYFKNTVYEVSDEVANYLARTFNVNFEIIEKPKPKVEPKVEAKEEVKEPKVDVKEFVKLRGKTAKKVVEKD